MKKVILIFFSMLTSLILATTVAVVFFTESFYTHLGDQILAWNGAQERFEAGIQYYEKNECRAGEACQCVLLLHGLGDTMATWTKLLSLKPDTFSTPLHLFAPNMPGSVKSAFLEKPEDYNIESLSQRISKLFLPKCESWIVAGNSFGGWMSVDVALDASEKVKGLLLLDPAGLKKDYSHVLNFFLHPSVAEAKHFYTLTYAKTLPLPNFVFETLAERLKHLPVKEQLLSVKEKDYLNGRLPKLNVPVVFLWGEKDRVIPAAWGKEYQALTKNSDLKIAPACGHIPQKECLPQVTTALNELLSKVQSKSRIENVMK